MHPLKNGQKHHGSDDFPIYEIVHTLFLCKNVLAYGSV